MATMLSMQDFFKTDLFSGPEQKPQSISETGVRKAILEDLALKILYMSGALSVLDLSDRMKLSFEVANDLFIHMRTERFCQVTGMIGNIPNISITSDGRTRAMELLFQSHYAGPAPIALERYVEQVKKQSVRDVQVLSLIHI